LKLFLDSTYLIPALDIDISEGWSKADLKNLIKNDKYDLYYCDLSLFEIYTKCMKLILQDKLRVEIETVQNGIQSILNSSRLFKINWWENIFESNLILKFKEIHNDSIDCIILYLAIVNCDILATFDDYFIKKVKQSDDIKKIIEEINPEFRILFNDLSRESIRLIE